MQANAIAIHDDHHDADSTDVFGFWLYIMTDVVLFGCLFATYLVLNSPHTTGPSLKKYIDLKYTLIETFFLLASNFTFCLAALSVYKQKLHHVQFWLFVTFILGGCFVAMELSEFHQLYLEGFRWDISAHASSFFTLVGTHGLHVSVGLCWIFLTIVQLAILKLSPVMKRRMTYLGLFWNFLDMVWIFVFTVVYLMGVMS